MLLPLDANYSQWIMGKYHDGRTYIRYRTGNYLIHKTMEKSKMNKMNYKIIKISLTILSLFFFQFSVNAQLADKIEITEDNQLLGLGTQYILKSEILQEDRPIIISLPIGYENNEDAYPVLYLLDGLGNIKHQVGTVELLTESGVIPQ